jgi:hypothetical protein
MATVDSVLAQYEKNKNATSSNANKMSSEDRLKRYFTTVLPKGVKSGEKRIRILPTVDGETPFKEGYFHEIQIDGNWTKLYDPAQEGKRSPLNEVKDALYATKVQSDAELARQYRSRKFYIVKVIDRDNEQDGPKFWRFKHNAKGDGIMDKIFPVFQKKGDITDIETGRDVTLFLTLTKSGNGKEYTSINSVMPEDPTPLHVDPTQASAWVNDEMTWNDVYAKKPEEYLEMVAKGETPTWDVDTKKWVSNSQGEEVFKAPSAPIQDPQEEEDTDENLPF